MKNADNISISVPGELPSRVEIKHGMTIAAQLVQRYGPKYWPVLDRLKQEYDALDDREALLASLLSDADGINLSLHQQIPQAHRPYIVTLTLLSEILDKHDFSVACRVKRL
ncbi:hypothetical protein [Fretibacter rubidus]|uniref:hypothetical protein n=1 Tax=Fretibacter rubidus TaxID=570162 RepID=UPI00352A30C6